MSEAEEMEKTKRLVASGCMKCIICICTVNLVYKLFNVFFSNAAFIMMRLFGVSCSELSIPNCTILVLAIHNATNLTVVKVVKNKFKSLCRDESLLWWISNRNQTYIGFCLTMVKVLMTVMDLEVCCVNGYMCVCG